MYYAVHTYYGIELDIIICAFARNNEAQHEIGAWFRVQNDYHIWLHHVWEIPNGKSHGFLGFLKVLT